MPDWDAKLYKIALTAAFLFLRYLTAAQTNAPAWTSELLYAPAERFSFALDRYGVPTVTAHVGGAPVELQFDTGNMSGLALASDVADRLRLPVTGAAKMYDADGTFAGKRRTFLVTRLSAWQQTWTNVSAVELAQKDISGLIGPQYFGNGRVTLDYARHLLAISPSALPDGTRKHAVPLITSRALPKLLVVRGEVNGYPVLIQIDTGKSRTCVDRTLAAKLGLSRVTGGYRIAEVKIGNVTFSVPSAREENFAGISETLPEPILLGVGSDLLSQVVFTVDYKTQLVLLSPQ